MEIWDLLDKNRNPLNKTMVRGQKRPDGAYHTVVSIFTVNSRGELLSTLRDPFKDEYPGKWENTAGSALSGETSRRAAVRELFEETGISVNEEELILLGTRREASAFMDIYLAKSDAYLCDIVLQKGETVGAKWVSVGEFLKMMENSSLAKPVGERFVYIREEFEKYAGR